MQWPFVLAVALMALGSAFSQGVPCPPGFENFSIDPMTQVCLKFATTMKGTWETWKLLCKADNTSLAKLEGDLHNQVYNYIHNSAELNDEVFWIGGTDANHEGYWVWESDNTPMPMGTPHWYPCNNQPNGGTEMNYACLYTPDFFFHSCRNTYEAYAICQI